LDVSGGAATARGAGALAPEAVTGSSGQTAAAESDGAEDGEFDVGSLAEVGSSLGVIIVQSSEDKKR
jgi:hypothetical protein